MAGVDIPKWMWELADDYPFSPPPPGVIPNFEHPHLVGYHSLTIGCACCLFFLLLFGTARLYAKLRLIRKITIDDYFFCAALFMLTLLLCLYMYLDNNGAYGYHAWEVKIRNLTRPLLVVTFVHQPILQITVWLVKATLMFLILGAFKTVRWLRALCVVGLVTTLIFYTAGMIIILIACHPRDDSTAAVQKLAIASGIFGVISDFYILIIPLPAVAKLNIPKKRKLGVYLIFSSGAMACVASITSLAFRVHSFGTKDLTVDEIPVMTAHIVELTVGLIVTCIAPVAKLIRSILGKHFPSFVQDTAKQSGAQQEEIQLAPRRKHLPGGLSEIDSMKTFGTTVDIGISKDSSSTKHLTENASPYGTSY